MKGKTPGYCGGWWEAGARSGAVPGRAPDAISCGRCPPPTHARAPPRRRSPGPRRQPRCTLASMGRPAGAEVVRRARLRPARALGRGSFRGQAARSEPAPIAPRNAHETPSTNENTHISVGGTKDLVGILALGLLASPGFPRWLGPLAIRQRRRPAAGGAQASPLSSQNESH